MEQLEPFDGLDRRRHLLDRGLVGDVATQREVGQEQVVFDHRHERVDLARPEPEPWSELADDRHAALGVIARISLADVVEQSPHHQQVRAADPRRQLGGVGRGLPQVTIDRETVVGVALRLRSDGLPFGHEAPEELVLIERFEGRQRSVSFEEQRDQFGSRADRPVARKALDVVLEPVERLPSDAHTEPGRGDGSSECDRLVLGRIRTIGQLDLAVEQHDPRRDRPVRGHVGARDRPIPVLVDEPCDRPARHRHRRHHVVGVLPPALGGGSVLVLEAEHLPRTFGRQLERDPGAEQDVVAAGEVGLVGRPHVHPTLLRPAERLDVAQAAVPVLQVGFEAIRHLRLLVLPGHDQVPQGQQVASGLRSPHLETGGHHLAGEFVVAGERPDGEHRRGRFEIGPRQLDLILHTAHRVAELHAGVPDRIPDR